MLRLTFLFVWSSLPLASPSICTDFTAILSPSASDIDDAISTCLMKPVKEALGIVGTVIGGIVRPVVSSELGIVIKKALDDTAELMRSRLERFLKWLLVRGHQEFCRALETMELDCGDRPPCYIVRSTWRKLSFRYHPDHKISREEKAEAEVHQKKLNIAWEVALEHFGGLGKCKNKLKDEL